MQKAAGDGTLIEQEAETIAEAEVADHVAEYHTGGTGGETGTPVAEPWDVDAVNQAKALLTATRMAVPDLPETQVDAVTIVWDVYGEGSGDDGLNYVDLVNSTWLP